MDTGQLTDRVESATLWKSDVSVHDSFGSEEELLQIVGEVSVAICFADPLAMRLYSAGLDSQVFLPEALRVERANL